MIDNDLRNLIPAERRMSQHKKQQLKERIMEDIGTDSTPAQRRYPKRRLVGGLVAATVLVTGTATAAAVWLGGPDPQQAKQVVEKMPDPVAERYLGDWRPALRAEFVACIGPDSNRLTDPRETGDTSASEFPLADNLTVDLLITECTSGNDWARLEGGFDQDKAKACVREGDYPLAVVALEGLTCEDAGDNVRPISDSDLAQLNKMRGFEVAVLANPEQCPTLNQAAEWSRQQITARGEHLTVQTIPGNPDGCFGGTTYWDQGQVVVEMTSIPDTNQTEDPSGSTTTIPAKAQGPVGD
ncbi:MAG TPA: hypothetical protein VL068_08050 [Microthrixaceae bacterium]|nr:hypothetical protein [Microthrixaceae bacterium]